MQIPDAPPYRVSAGAGVGLVSAALVGTELVLTRIFSVIVWYHFAFFAISVALFGVGAAALVVHIFFDRFAPRDTASLCARAASVLSVTIAGVDWLLVNVTPDWFAPGAMFTVLTGKLLLLFALAASPFFVGGFCISLAMARWSASAHRVYFWDLLGAAAACLLVIAAMGLLGGPGALLAMSGPALGAAIAFGWPERGDGRVRRWTAVAAGTILFACALAPITGWLEVRVAKGVDLARAQPEYNRWNSFSMVTVLPEVGFRGWGMSPRYQGPVPAQKTLVIDMNAMTTLTRFDGRPESVRHALFDLSAMVYAVRPDPSRVCVIGAGGGKDVLAALAAGADHVSAVEINPLIVDDVMRRRYADFTGRLFLRDDVDVHVDDGRSFVRSAEQRFDVILLSMVDTSAATAAGAYALTENSLYTVDAFEDFMDRLEPEGILSVSTVSLEGLAVGARLVAVARAALEQKSRDPRDALMVVETPWLVGEGAVLYDVLVKPAGFSEEEVQRAEVAIRARGFRPTYLPGRPSADRAREQRWISTVITAPGAALEAKMAAWPLDVTPVSDDRPYFFYQNRLRDIPRALMAKDASHLFGNGLVILAKVLALAVILTLAVFVVPLVVRRREVRAGAGSATADIAFVACLGFGFMFIEIAAMQRLSLYLGKPTYTLSVVLFVLLLFGALGSRAFSIVSAARVRGGLAAALVGVVALAALFDPVADRALGATVSWSSEARAVVAAVLLAPLGCLLGIAFPTGLRSVGERAPERVPWLWSVNSTTSVLGSVLATLISLHGGIATTFLFGSGLYLLAVPLSAIVAAPHGLPLRNPLR